LKVILSIDPIKYPLTGIGRYTYELAQALAMNDQVVSLRFLRGARLCESISEPVQVPNSLGGIASLLQKNRVAVELYRHTMSYLKAQTLNGKEDHVYHGPNFYLPNFRGKSAVTIHDLSTFLWSSCHPPERVRYMQAEIELSLKRASILITDSEFTRKEVARHFNWPLKRIHAISLASSSEFYPHPYAALFPVLEMYGLSANGYCLFAGTIEPRKNIDSLLDAYALLPSAVRKKWPLVLAGYKGWKSEKLHARIANAQRNGWVRYIGFVPSDHLPALFAGARLFAFPSLYEGFGLPVLEAMASAVPVVCSNSSSLPEVVGDAAAMCDALDVHNLVRLLLVGLEDEEWRSHAIAKGLARAAGFSWSRCACETISAYRSALCI